RKISERFRELQEQLDRRVQETIRDDRAFVKDTIGVAFKVAGFAVAVVVVVLGALGLKTYLDFDKMTIGTAHDAAQRKIDDYFNGPDGKRITESAVDHAVVDSYYARFARQDADNWPPSMRPKIEDPDVDRLLRIISSNDTKDTDFCSAAYVLMRGLVPTSNVAKIFSDFITAKDKDELWRARNKAKRLWLLNKLATSNFSDQQITGACLEVISSDHEKEYKPAALLTVARIDPTNSVLTELEKIPKPSVETIMAALKISEALKQNPEAGDA